MMPDANVIRQQSRRLARSEMLDWIKETSGEPISAADFDKLMRKVLPKENYYQTAVMKWIQETYPSAFVWKAAAGPYSRQGIPDVCAIIDGRFYGFEIKRPFIGELSKIQEETIKAIWAAGGIAAVVSFPEQARSAIDSESLKEARA